MAWFRKLLAQHALIGSYIVTTLIGSTAGVAVALIPIIGKMTNHNFVFAHLPSKKNQRVGLVKSVIHSQTSILNSFFYLN